MYDLYQSNKDDSVRFLLGKHGENMLYVIGLNPSKATQAKSDVTAAKVERVACNNGFDGFVMANLCPIRSTDPNGLPDAVDSQLIAQNARAILGVTQQNPVFWAAWGGGIILRSHLLASLDRIAERVRNVGGRWVHFGALRKDGHPRHPSRLSYAWQFSEFDLPAYLQNLKKHRR